MTRMILSLFVKPLTTTIQLSKEWNPMSTTDQAAPIKMIPTSRLPAGFRFAGVTCGLKRSGKPDLTLIVADANVAAAGVYTTNQVVAAPVILCRSRTPSDKIRAVVINSGNANACTGEAGMLAAQATCGLVAAQVGCKPEQVLVMSTGVIGHQLPMDRIESGIQAAASKLAPTMESFHQAADAITTTDNGRKVACYDFQCHGKTYSIAAMAKGAGMIAPNMATMLALVLTDAPLSAQSARDTLSIAAEKSFNRVSVDGHTSTNDTCLLLSSGQGEVLSGEALQQFQQAMNQISIELAKKLVADGEGAIRVMAIRVTGAANDKDAFVIAKTVAASPLVKTAMTGGDPNWGRIVSAAGYAEAKIKPELTCLRLCNQMIYENGTPLPFNAAALSNKMKQQSEVEIELQVGDGTGTADYWSSDLTTDYVRFNSEYTT
jgi:glutamate N-acetyltransferase / amino-acid N-acetyltransferase